MKASLLSTSMGRPATMISHGAARATFLSLFLLLSLCLLQAQPSSVPRDDFWVPDGPVHTMLETDGVIYVGGQFDYISPNAGTGGAFDLVSGASLTNFPRFAGAIKTIITDNAGGWFVGGSFVTVDGLPIANLAHVRADKTVDANWRPNPDGAVLALVSGSGLLYAGGNFSTIAGRPRSGLAALDPLTATPLAEWQADVERNDLPGRTVTSLVLSRTRLYVGGNFSLINGVEREHLAALDAATGAVEEWVPNAAIGAEAFARVDALAISETVLFVGGTFSSLGGTNVSFNVQTDRPPRHFLAALDTTKNLGESVLPWNPEADGPVSSIVVSCDTVYVGGSFTIVGGTNRNHIAALNILTGRATGWNPDADGLVLKLARAGDLVYAGGKFTHIGGQPRSFLAALDINSAQATPWNPRADSSVAGLAFSGGAVVAGGSFSPGGKIRKNVAAFDARTGRLLDWNPSITGSQSVNGAAYQSVEVMVVRSNILYLGGNFSSVNAQPRNGLAAIHAATGALELWDPNPDGYVRSLAAADDAIYAGGVFSAIGGAPRTNIAALHPTLGSATSWNPGANEKVAALSVLGRTVYAGGLFSQIGGAFRRRIAALDAATGGALPWDPGANNQVSALLALGSRIHVGGHFSRIGGMDANRIAALDAVSGELDCWRPDARRFEDGTERSAAINCIAASGNTVYAGGAFSVIGGEPRRQLAAIHPTCPGAATDWNPDVDAPVKALSVAGGSVVAGGLFQNIGGTYHPSLAVFPPLGAPVMAVQPRGKLIAAGQSASLEGAAAGEGMLSYQWQLNGTNLPGSTSPALLIANAQVADSGDYTLVVTNSLGLINSRPATLTVVEPVLILAQPVSQTVAPGANVTLSVTAAGNPPPVYQWRLNGVDIPGAIQSTFTITNAQPADGGSYNVVVASIGGAVNSAIATLQVTRPDLELGFRDNLANRLMIVDASGLGSGSNVGATNETDEPHHVGKLGGRSVWLGWIAPSNGIATFNTRGSSFDTLLAIYTGPTMEDLSPLAADEDSGGFLTSQASFNAVAGTEYLIAVDGFGGASGNIVLRWNLDTSTVPFPRIVTQPLSLTVTNEGRAEFAVTVDKADVTFQWFRECRAIDGATSSNLVIAFVQPSDVGRYHVEVRNASAYTSRSFDASLDLGPDLKVISQDKLEDLLGAALSGEGGALFHAASTSGGFLSVAAGSIDSQRVNNTGSTTQLRETNHCAVLGGASQWLGLEAVSDGVLVIDTIGSTIDTVMAVYRPTNVAYLSTAVVTCDNNGAPDGIRSLVSFPAVHHTKYLVVIDGVNHAQGAISINWKLGVPPPQASNIPAAVTVRPGASVTLTANTTNGIPAPDYHWLLNGTPIGGATGKVFTLRDAQLQQAGTYSVIVSNFAGIVLETNAVLTMSGPLRLSGLGFDSNGHYRLSVNGIVSPGFILQATTNVGDSAGAVWTSLLTNSTPEQPFLFFDSNAPVHRRRFYRAKDAP